MIKQSLSGSKIERGASGRQRAATARIRPLFRSAKYRPRSRLLIVSYPFSPSLAREVFLAKSSMIYSMYTVSSSESLFPVLEKEASLSLSFCFFRSLRAQGVCVSGPQAYIGPRWGRLNNLQRQDTRLCYWPIKYPRYASTRSLYILLLRILAPRITAELSADANFFRPHAKVGIRKVSC